MKPARRWGWPGRQPLCRLIVLVLLCAGTGLQAQESASRLQLLHADELAGVVERGRPIRRVKGNVLFRHGQTEIRCKEAIDIPSENRWILRGQVVIHDKEKTLRADQVTYDATRKIYTASAQVTLVTDSTEIRASRMQYSLPQRKAIAEKAVRILNPGERNELQAEFAEYERDTEYARLTKNPVFIQYDSSGQEETRIIGEVMESYERGKKVSVDRNVQIYHGDIYATCGHADYLRQEEKIILSQDPVARQKNNELRGTRMTLLLQDRKIHEVHVLGNALATLFPDSADQSMKPSTISGQKLIAYIENDAVSRVRVEGTATCVYYLYEQGRYKGMNKSQGDELTLYLVGNSIRRILFDSNPGKSTGRYTPAAVSAASDSTGGESSAKAQGNRSQTGR